MKSLSTLGRADGTSVVETLLIMTLAAVLAIAAGLTLRPRLAATMVHVVECVLNEDCRP